jgi:hypothetical protein
MRRTLNGLMVLGLVAVLSTATLPTPASADDSPSVARVATVAVDGSDSLLPPSSDPAQWGGWGAWGGWPWWAGRPLWQISAMTNFTWPWFGGWGFSFPGWGNTLGSSQSIAAGGMSPWAPSAAAPASEPAATVDASADNPTAGATVSQWMMPGHLGETPEQHAQHMAQMTAQHAAQMAGACSCSGMPSFGSLPASGTTPSWGMSPFWGGLGGWPWWAGRPLWQISAMTNFTWPWFGGWGFGFPGWGNAWGGWSNQPTNPWSLPAAAPTAPSAATAPVQ